MNEVTEDRLEEAITDHFLMHTRDGILYGHDLRDDMDTVYDLAGHLAIVITEASGDLDRDAVEAGIRAFGRDMGYEIKEELVKAGAYIAVDLQIYNQEENDQ